MIDFKSHYSVTPHGIMFLGNDRSSQDTKTFRWKDRELYREDQTDNT